MGPAGTRNTNSPRASEIACIFFALAAESPASGSGISVIAALGSAKPDSRKTVPPTNAYDSAAVLSPALAPSGITAANKNGRLMPILLFFLFFFIFLFVLVVIELVLFFLLLFVFRCFQLERIEAGYAKIGAALLAGQRVTFIPFVLVQVDYGVSVWTVGHLPSLQEHIFLIQEFAAGLLCVGFCHAPPRGRWHHTLQSKIQEELRAVRQFMLFEHLQH